LNADDEIEVFSKEDFPFYNRVLLPDYLSGALPWKNLVKMSDEEEFDFNISLYRGVSIEGIDRQKKLVTDNKGGVHHYDVLIMATGSRAAILKDVPSMKGIFTMRSRQMLTGSRII
jgi:ferredoxin-nitrate reductase